MPRRRYKIVHLDDEYTIGIVVCSEFRWRGFEAFYLPSKIEGIEWVKRYRPDLVISDIRSPEMDGLEYLKILRSHPSTSQIPFVFVTGCDDLNLAREAVRLGANDYITKPFELETLLHCVVRVLEQESVSNPSAGRPGAHGVGKSGGLSDAEWPEISSLFKSVLPRFASRATITGEHADWRIDFLFEHEQTLFGGMFWRPLEFGMLSYDDLMGFRAQLDTDGLDFGLVAGFHAVDREKLAFGRMLGIEILSEEETADLLEAGRRLLLRRRDDELLVDRVNIPFESLYESRKINRFLKTTWNELQLLQGEWIARSRRSEEEFPMPPSVSGGSPRTISIEKADGSGFSSVDKTDCVRALMELWAKESLARDELVVPEYRADDLFRLLSSLPYVNLRDNRINLHPVWKPRRRR